MSDNERHRNPSPLRGLLIAQFFGAFNDNAWKFRVQAQFPRLPLEKGLSIHVFSVFDCQHIKPFRTNETVENSIGPYSVGAYLLLLVSSLKRFAFQWVSGQIPKSFFDFRECRRVEGLEVFFRLGREANFFHCSSPNTSLKVESFFALASLSPWSRASTV